MKAFYLCGCSLGSGLKSELLNVNRIRILKVSSTIMELTLLLMHPDNSLLF